EAVGPPVFVDLRRGVVALWPVFGRGGGRLLGFRKVDGDRRALAILAFDIGEAVMRFRESINMTEPQSRPFAGLLCGEKGFEDMRQNFRPNARSCVVDRQPQAVSPAAIRVGRAFERNDDLA